MHAGAYVWTQPFRVLEQEAIGHAMTINPSKFQVAMETVHIYVLLDVVLVLIPTESSSFAPGSAVYMTSNGKVTLDEKRQGVKAMGR